MTTLRVSKEEAIRAIMDRINDISRLQQMQPGPGYYDIVDWCSKTYAAVDNVFGAADFHAEDIRITGLPTCSCMLPMAATDCVERYRSRLLDYIAEIQGGILENKPETQDRR